jgi:hypothetical protein
MEGRYRPPILPLALLVVAGMVPARVSGQPAIKVSFDPSPSTVALSGDPVTYVILVTNTGSEQVTLASLADTERGDLAGWGNCLLPQTLGAGASYECSFVDQARCTGTGLSETTTLTAVAEDALGAQISVSETSVVSIVQGLEVSFPDEFTMTYTTAIPEQRSLQLGRSFFDLAGERLRTDVFDERLQRTTTVLFLYSEDAWYAVEYESGAPVTCRRETLAGTIRRIRPQSCARRVERGELGTGPLGTVLPVIELVEGWSGDDPTTSVLAVEIAGELVPVRAHSWGRHEILITEEFWIRRFETDAADFAVPEICPGGGGGGVDPLVDGGAASARALEDLLAALSPGVVADHLREALLP